VENGNNATLHGFSKITPTTCNRMADSSSAETSNFSGSSHVQYKFQFLHK